MLRKHKKILIVIVPLLVAVLVYALFFRLYPSDCTAAEKYDALTGSCYYECTTDQDCTAKARLVDDELNKYFQDSQTRVADTGSETNGKVYAVTKSLQLDPKPSDHDEQLWGLFTRVAGADAVAKYIQSFEVFDDSNNDTAASVWQSQTEGKWHVNVNAAYVDDKKDLIHTMVHEYGHIVSLNAAQIDGSVQGSCPNLSLSEGCAQSNAYINSFYNQFWAKYGDDAPANEGDNASEVTEFYDQNKQSFVSEYAATNYTEDWAESWAAFVTKAKPTGNQEKDKKVLGMYNYPVLVNERNRIRVQIADLL